MGREPARGEREGGGKGNLVGGVGIGSACVGQVQNINMGLVE